MKRIVLSLMVFSLSISYGLNAQSKKTIQNKSSVNQSDSLKPLKLIHRIDVGYSILNQSGALVSKTYFDGLKVGLSTELPFNKNISLLAGVHYNMLTSDKIQKYPSSTSAHYVTHWSFLDAPIQCVLNLPVSKNLSFFAFGGPTLTYGLSQIQNVVSTYNDTFYGIPSGYTNLYTSNLNRFDVQVGVGGGIQLKSYRLKGGYDWGLLDGNKLNANSIYLKGWSVAFGYKLGW